MNSNTANPMTFESLIRGEFSALRSLAMQLTRNTDDAKDLVQETLFKALRYKDRFSEGSNLRAWLFTILKNSFINQYRRIARRNTFIDTTDNTYFLDIPGHKTENAADLHFIRKDLDRAIERLPKELRVTFLLNAEGFKYHEIADELNIPIGTVKTRIFVARRHLRRMLHMYGEDMRVSKASNE